MSVIIFVISLTILSLLLTISGINSENSFRLSILTLMNTVNSSLSGLSEFTFYDLNSVSKISLILFMMIGRVELLSIDSLGADPVLIGRVDTQGNAEKVTLTLPVCHVFGLWEVTTPESASIRTSPRHYSHVHALLFGLWVVDSITSRIFGEVTALRKMGEAL